MKKKALGRGLAALLGNASEPHPGEVVRSIAVDAIIPNARQPRVRFDAEALEGLAQSIRAQGLVQPIVVRPIAEGRFEIVAGERRFRAAQLAGLAEVPCLVRSLSDEAALTLALLENIQRENLSAVELAEAFARLIEEHGLTHQQLAEALGVSRAQVSNLLRLRQLPAEVLLWLHEGKLEMGHARALLGLEPGEQLELARQIVKQGWSVRQVEHRVRQQRQQQRQQQQRKDPNWVFVETFLADHLAAPVAIEHRARSGRLVIRFRTWEELHAILARMGIVFDETGEIG